MIRKYRRVYYRATFLFTLIFDEASYPNYDWFRSLEQGKGYTFVFCLYLNSIREGGKKALC